MSGSRQPGGQGGPRLLVSLREEAALRAAAQQQHDDDDSVDGDCTAHPLAPYRCSRNINLISVSSSSTSSASSISPTTTSTSSQPVPTGSCQNSNVLHEQHNQQGDLAASARKEWNKHGEALTQALEERRLGYAVASPTSSSFGSHHEYIVRIVAAETRVDPSGSAYTAYVIRVQQHHNTPSSSCWLMERRYSEFARLHHFLSSSGGVVLYASFPSKHWAGRLGNWTPSQLWAPLQHDELIQSRVIQLDTWLVHVVEAYHQSRLVGTAAAAVVEFLSNAPQRPPCERHEMLPAVTGSSSSRLAGWNNPLAFTLGSSIRQATRTVQYMIPNNNQTPASTGSNRCVMDPANNGNGNHPTTSLQHRIKAADQSIPLDLLQAAKGLLFLTVAKAGLVVSGRVGTGLVIKRLHNQCWSAPCAVGTVGMGWGAQVGGDITRYLVILTTEKAVDDLVASSSVQLGAELGIAVGPVGRGANSHVQTGDWTLHTAYAYAHSQGLFVGMSLEGSVISTRQDVNAKFYGQAGIDPADLLSQPGPTAAEPLYQALNQAMQQEIPQGSFRPSQVFSPKQSQQARPFRVPTSSAVAGVQTNAVA